MGLDLEGKELGVGFGQRNDGRYYFRFTDRFGKRKTIYADTKSGINKLSRDALKDDNLKQNIQKNMTVEKLFKFWNEVYRVDMVKRTTRRKERGIYNQMIKGRFEKKSIKSIDTAFLKSQYAELREISSRGSMEAWVYLVKGMFRMAYDENYIGVNPARSLKAPKRESNEKIPLTDEEIDMFLKYAKNNSYYNMFLVALNTGMRLGELSGLQFQDLDFEKRTIHIQRQAHYLHEKMSTDDDRFLIDPPKSYYSSRYIPMNDVVYSVLIKQREHNKKIMSKLPKRLNPTPYRYKDFVFLSQRGRLVYERMPNDAINRIINNIRRQEGIESFPHFTMHVLRVTFASKCYDNNINMKMIQNWLGHKNINTTMSIYVKQRVSNELYKMNEIASGVKLV